MLERMYFELCAGHEKVMDDYQSALDETQKVRGQMLGTTECLLSQQQFMSAVVRALSGEGCGHLEEAAQGDEVKLHCARLVQARMSQP
jgi:hypothetical protein